MRSAREKVDYSRQTRLRRPCSILSHLLSEGIRRTGIQAVWDRRSWRLSWAPCPGPPGPRPPPGSACSVTERAGRPASALRPDTLARLPVSKRAFSEDRWYSYLLARPRSRHSVCPLSARFALAVRSPSSLLRRLRQLRP